MQSPDPLEEAEKWLRNKGRESFRLDMQAVLGILEEEATAKVEKSRDFAIKKLNQYIQENKNRMPSDPQALKQKIKTTNPSNTDDIQAFSTWAKTYGKNQVAEKVVSLLQEGKPFEEVLEFVKRGVD
ncbi:MAG: hypothetical protein WHS38_05780 [Thermodesulforhabdaceae bacterium]|jgi:hypothetical protein